MGFDRQSGILSPTGAEINLYVTQLSAPRGVVQVNHGLAEHAARYARFAEFLRGYGFAVYAHDHRGHGHTKAPGAPLGSFGAEPAAQKVIADVAAVHDLIATEHAGVPVIVFGHSMGSLIAMNFVLAHSHRIAGAAIWNGNFSAGLLGGLAQAVLAWEKFRLGSDVPSRILPKLTFDAWAKKASDGRTPFDWLSRDHAEVDKYIADPLCGWNASVGMWKAVFDFVFAGANDRNFTGVRRDLPFNLVGGGGDPESEFGKTVQHLESRMRAMGFSNLVTRIYGETRHESLNEINRDIIMKDFAEWAVRAVSAR
ncbi:alpha/beta hydrolase [Mesorhizobium microcysteis]|uniref:Alpha/beta hydrolase n=1 Tax=Neoaquamicrobium microcysteis TaxID=2682781 RepID=A0A5D4GVC4_9HYPH|nr:alpha/beta hydrolase [Mesorhizobium microcysteis]TYR32337.1 alpha/beta hydrolase [Mesorhizobium microcysteis]